MLFVDGENLAIQAKDEAEKRGLELVPGPHYVTDTFVWMPGISATQRWLPGLSHPHYAVRATRSVLRATLH
jgi:hypothetical protein